MIDSIRPTTTQRVRGFLAEQGLAPAPWSTLDETYAALYRLLRTRAYDNGFWKPLARLIGDIVADAADGRRRTGVQGAELLRSWDVEELVRDMRRSLPSPWEGAPSVRRFAASLAAPALGGFLLFGLAAAGCDEADEAECGGDAGPAWTQGCSLDCGTELFGAIEDNETLTTDEKSGLCGCLTEEPADTQSWLSSLFEDCDPEAIASALEDLVAQCESQGAIWTTDTALLACGTGFAYKGVSFPS
jgi:hypothetical protein